MADTTATATSNITDIDNVSTGITKLTFSKGHSKDVVSKKSINNDDMKQMTKIIIDYIKYLYPMIEEETYTLNHGKYRGFHMMRCEFIKKCSKGDFWFRSLSKDGENIETNKAKHFINGSHLWDFIHYRDINFLDFLTSEVKKILPTAQVYLNTNFKNKDIKTSCVCFYWKPIGNVEVKEEEEEIIDKDISEEKSIDE